MSEAISETNETLTAMPDPLRLCYIESLLSSASNKSAPLQSRLLDKAFTAALTLLDSCASDQPVRQLVSPDSSELLALRQLIESLDSEEETDCLDLALQTVDRDAAADNESGTTTGSVSDNKLSGITSDNSQRSLRAQRRSRRLATRRAVEQYVDQTIDMRPDNPGPLNPAKLAVQSLMRIRELSPDYFERYVRFSDTLLALDTGTRHLQK